MLTRKNLKTAGSVGAHLLAFAGLISGFKSAPAAAPVETKTDTAGQLNVASLKAIESSWLQVPASCKAKGFNAEPRTIETEALHADVSAIYQNLQA
jgi:hypothetical protein